jgi:two-component system, LytTR family, response regulator
VRIAIVDDEELARGRLARLCRAHADVEIVGDFGDASEAARELPGLAADLVFLDIRMPQQDGFDVASAIVGTDVVFVTAYDEYAVKAFAAGAVDYLLKPIDAAGLARALDRVRSKTPRTPARIAVRDGGRFIFVTTNEIDAIVAAGNYVELRAGGKVYSLRATLASMNARLDPKEFVRVHRSALVRVDRIASIEPLFRGEYLVTLADGTTLTSSRSQRAVLRGALGLPP